MVKEQLEAILATAEARAEEGWLVLPEGRSLTLYLAKDGVGLNVSRIEAALVEGSFVRARTLRGEVFVVAISDIFAVATEGNASKSKKAGFV
jgi:hypothetical protein